jgi:hypothetical protein
VVWIYDSQADKGEEAQAQDDQQADEQALVAAHIAPDQDRPARLLNLQTGNR